MDSWKNEAGDSKFVKALESPHLEAAIDHYGRGFLTCLSHYYSGLNQLALLTVQLVLAEALPDVWNHLFDSDEAAACRLKELGKRKAELVGAVKMALEAAKQSGDKSRWHAIGIAEVSFLSAETPRYVGSLYKRALNGASAQEIDAVERQLRMLQEIGLFGDCLREAIAALEEAKRDGGGASPEADRVVVFTGHRVDEPNRATDRFPRTGEAENIARQMIREEVEKQAAGAGRVIGYSGGACGGDVLFQEVCQELGIESEMLLAAERDEFVNASVRTGGSDWIRRFDELSNSRKVRRLAPTLGLPLWIKKDDYSVWQRNNRWIVNSGLAYGTRKVVLIALWDGKAGDGPGGTKDMIETVENRGGLTRVLDAKKLLGS
jgi:hypothetical protein